MQETVTHLNQLLQQYSKAQSLLIDSLQKFEEQQQRREREGRRRNRCRCLEHFDSSNSDDELIVVSKSKSNAPERESRRYRRADRKRDRSRSRGRSRGHSRGRSHGRSRSRSLTNAAHRRQLSLAVEVNSERGREKE